MRGQAAVGAAGRAALDHAGRAGRGRAPVRHQAGRAGLTGIGADPPVAIGQRSLLVPTAEGNLLWDPSGFIDDAAVAAVRVGGGLRS